MFYIILALIFLKKLILIQINRKKYNAFIILPFHFLDLVSLLFSSMKIKM